MAATLVIHVRYLAVAALTAVICTEYSHTVPWGMLGGVLNPLVHSTAGLWCFMHTGDGTE